MSGKGARAKSKIRRLKQKRARKAAMQARYEAYKKLGQNRKSKRNKRDNKKGSKPVRSNRHAVSFCGNLGCSQCYENINDPLQAKPGTVLFGRGEYIRYLRKRDREYKVEIV